MILLVTLFAWAFADESQLSITDQPTRLLKNSSEWVNFQLNFSKESIFGSLEKDLIVAHAFVLENSAYNKTNKLDYSFIDINQYQRNPFYRLTSIHAP